MVGGFEKLGRDWANLTWGGGGLGVGRGPDEVPLGGEGVGG